MDTLIIIKTITEIVFLLTFLAAAVYGFAAFKKITSSVNKLEQSVIQFTADAGPVIRQISEIAGDIRELTVKSKTQYSKVESMVNGLVERGNELNAIIKISGDKAKSAVLESSNFVSALSKGLKAFGTKIYN